MLAIYCDEDSMNAAVIAALRTRGFDMLSAHDAGTQRFSDSAQLEFAAAEGGALYTANRKDFARLHVQWLTGGREHAGIICNTDQRARVGVQVRGLGAIAAARGQLLYLSNFAAQNP